MSLSNIFTDGNYQVHPSKVWIISKFPQKKNKVPFFINRAFDISTIDGSAHLTLENTAMDAQPHEIFTAAKKGDKNKIEQLLDGGVEVNSRDKVWDVNILHLNKLWP